MSLLYKASDFGLMVSRLAYADFSSFLFLISYCKFFWCKCAYVVQACVCLSHWVFSFLLFLLIFKKIIFLQKKQVVWHISQWWSTCLAYPMPWIESPTVQKQWQLLFIIFHDYVRLYRVQHSGCTHSFKSKQNIVPVQD